MELEDRIPLILGVCAITMIFIAAYLEWTVTGTSVSWFVETIEAVLLAVILANAARSRSKIQARVRENHPRCTKPVLGLLGSEHFYAVAPAALAISTVLALGHHELTRLMSVVYTGLAVVILFLAGTESEVGPKALKAVEWGTLFSFALIFLFDKVLTRFNLLEVLL